MFFVSVNSTGKVKVTSFVLRLTAMLERRNPKKLPHATWKSSACGREITLWRSLNSKVRLKFELHQWR